MKLLKNASFVCLLCVVLCFIGSKHQVQSQNIVMENVANENELHPNVHVNNSGHAGASHSSATVAPYISGVELGEDGSEYRCDASVKIDENPKKVSDTHRKKAPRLFAIIKKKGKKHKITITLTPSMTEIEYKGIKYKGTLTPINGNMVYTVEWTTEKLKLDPDFKKLRDFNWHFWVSPGEVYKADAEGEASGPNTSQDRTLCTARCDPFSYYGIVAYGYASCSNAERKNCRD